MTSQVIQLAQRHRARGFDERVLAVHHHLVRLGIDLDPRRPIVHE